MEDTVFLFSSFRDNGQDGLHLAFSHDGLHWMALNNDESYLTPQVGKEKLMRDPCIAQGPDGVFHMVWTDSWSDQTIGYAFSPDLLYWSPQVAIPVMEHEPTARNCWAPEIHFDSGTNTFLIFWSTTIPGRVPETEIAGDDGYNHRLYCTTTEDFKTFSPTKLFFEPGFNVIDATMVTSFKQPLMVVKNETLEPVAKNLFVAFGDSPYGPFTEVLPPFTKSWVEGPTVLKVNDWFIVYFDCYIEGKYEAMRTQDFVHWEDISDQISFPTGTRHGTAFEVPRKILEGLQASGK